MGTAERKSEHRDEARSCERDDARDLELETLRWHWDEAYEITWDDGRFRAGRHDGRGRLEAGTAAELRALVIADYTERPVPRRYGRQRPCIR